MHKHGYIERYELCEQYKHILIIIVTGMNIEAANSMMGTNTNTDSVCIAR